MEHSWRPRPPPPPPIQGNNTCPTCSISHFPFCPPPLPFTQNPSFLSPTPPPFQRPLFDPFLDPPPPNVNLHRPFPDDRLVDPRPWHRNPSFEDSVMVHGGYRDGFAPDRFDHGGTGFKRMRVDEMGRGAFANDDAMNPLHISMDNERRLKLIRDHGGVAGDREAKGYLRGNTVFDRGFGGIDSAGSGRFDELRGGRNGMTLKPHSNSEMDEFRDPRFGNFDGKGSYFRPERDFNPQKYGGEQENSRAYRNNEEFGQCQYGQPNGHTRQGLDAEALYYEGEIQHYSNLGNSYPQSQQGGSLSTENRNCNHHMSQPYAMQNPMQLNHDIHFHGQLNDRSGNQYLNRQDGYVSLPFDNMHTLQASRMVNVQPPLPASPPPPLPVDPPGHPLSGPHALSSPAITPSSLFPIAVSSAATMPASYASVAETNSLARPYFHDRSRLHSSTSFATEEFQNNSGSKYLGQSRPLPLTSSDKPKAVDASHIFKQPHRATRPDHIVIILRGLPGSGKSYLAKMLRDLEVENGGDAPRIHSMDDYFMTEVEKLEESDVSKSSSSVRGKKPVMKKVMEYCYEPEMEEAYRSSMLKAFKKTLDEGVFCLVIVDDRNLRVADFAQFWATAKRSGYEVYLVEAPYKDPVGCAARNLHGFTRDDVEKMAGLWEEAPSLYLKLDTKSLFQGDDLKESGIQEVDMDTEDGDSAHALPGLDERNEITVLLSHDCSPDGSSKDDKKWDAEGEHLVEEVKELGRSKWSDDLDDGNAKRTEATKRNLSSVSGLIKAYAKGGKSVHWGDQVGSTGFSIGVARQVNVSLVIGPGAGYNLISNPVPEEPVSTRSTGKSKGQSVFQERIRAERESFKAVFDKRRQRIRGLNLEEE
ncbi:hypothetical protein RHSIM_Rhsim12G0159100 [Rhododendron simsii]|uniref:YLP motif-containing protein 1 n=1 Tax=Rhododendron simsii TaxID=118357 RepID=A0A834G2Y7_RHOSS|nr:hypothetical protein RHSIM_Rhsim12G0159100 [Rhododendron simsii]